VTQLSACPAALPTGKAARFVCLQYGDALADVERARQAGLDMAYWPEAIKDLDEFAALVAALDLVVTVCNTTVHYAGALARPVWIMAPRVPEWRYGLHSTSLPWYLSSRIVRQASDGDWQPVIDQVASDLRAAYGPDRAADDE
jgi:2-methylisocitrate lyase-like PEP mutase family enzyme